MTMLAYGIDCRQFKSLLCFESKLITKSTYKELHFRKIDFQSSSYIDIFVKITDTNGHHKADQIWRRYLHVPDNQLKQDVDYIYSSTVVVQYELTNEK